MYCNSPFINMIIHPDDIQEYGCCTIFEPIEKTRKDIINNNISDICRLCESKHLFNGFDYEAERNKNLIKNNIIDIYIEELNISICNECNLRCRTCQLDHSKHNTIKLDDIKYRRCNNLVIQGGEPFSYKDTLLDIIKNIKFNNLTIITNGTIIDNEILMYLNSLENVYIIFSIDGVGKVNDYIRINSNFNILTSNIKNIIINYREIKYLINYTVNIFNIINIEKYLIELYDMFNIKINLNLLVQPLEYNIRNLERDIKNNVILKITKKIIKLKEITVNNSIINTMMLINKKRLIDNKNIIKLINKIDRKYNINYNDFLDKDTIHYIRNIGCDIN